MIRLYTPRLRIRDHVISDLPTHHELLSDPKTMWYLPDILTHSLKKSRENLQQSIDQIGLPERKLYFLRMENRMSEEHIGEIGYTVNDVTSLGKLVGMGYFIRESQWGQGYTAEALREVIRFAFEQDGVYRITCGCLKENRASERAMQKCGMIKEAEFKEYQWHDGRLKDRVEYRLLRSDWASDGSR